MIFKATCIDPTIIKYFQFSSGGSAMNSEVAGYSFAALFGFV